MSGDPLGLEITVHLSLPEGEELGALLKLDNGMVVIVTKTELERIRNLPSTEEIARQVGVIRSLMGGQP
jgi:hypothetical protein